MASEGNSRGIMFNEFYFGQFGLPHDFFSMNLSKVAHLIQQCVVASCI